MEISFVGDICLGRNVREKYEKSAYQLVEKDLINRIISPKGKVIANLESPVADDIHSKGIRFSGTSAMLSQFNWVDCFSLANNHINDFGEEGMLATIESIKKEGLNYNGLYEGDYAPYMIDDGENKIAIIMCSYGVNRKINLSCRYKLLSIREDTLYTLIKKYKQLGCFVIVYAHMGIMFCRFPNSSERKTIQNMINNGCDCLMVSHSHCIGGVYKYNNIPVFYSLGDFLMDGESFRRRQSYVVKLSIVENKLVSWELIPAVTGLDLRVCLPSPRRERRIKRRIEKVSFLMSKQRVDYKRFYKVQYKKDVFIHSLSTICFAIKTKGIRGGLKTLSSRKKDVHSMVNRVRTDKYYNKHG